MNCPPTEQAFTTHFGLTACQSGAIEAWWWIIARDSSTNSPLIMRCAFPVWPVVFVLVHSSCLAQSCLRSENDGRNHRFHRAPARGGIRLARVTVDAVTSTVWEPLTGESDSDVPMARDFARTTDAQLVAGWGGLARKLILITRK